MIGALFAIDATAQLGNSNVRREAVPTAQTTAKLYRDGVELATWTVATTVLEFYVPPDAVWAKEQ
jgi:hypothetical protein